LVAQLFLLKISCHSREIKSFRDDKAAHEKGDVEEFLSGINYLFFGFAVPRRNVAAYWVGFIIYLVTLIYASFNLFTHLAA
jgi:hypothetical protein